MNTLQRQLVEKFHVAPEEADRLIREAEAKTRMKAAIIGSAAEGQRVTAADQDLHDPEVWREEIRKRMQALEVLQEGVKSLEQCGKLLKRIIQAEQKLIAGKTTTVNHRGMDWWTFNESGWAMGGREQFAQNIAAIFTNIDEPKIAGQIIDKIGFKRAIPMPEDDVPPLAPAGEPEPAQRGKDPSENPNRQVPAHVAIEAMLVRGAVATDEKKLSTTIKRMGFVFRVSPEYSFKELREGLSRGFDPAFEGFYGTLIWDKKRGSDMASKSALRENIKKMLGASAIHGAKNVEKEILSQIRSTLKAAGPAYSKHFNSEVKFGENWANLKTTRKGGSTWVEAWMYDAGRDLRYWLLIQINRGIGIESIYPEVRGARDENTLWKGERQRTQYSHESFPVKMLAEPDKLFKGLEIPEGGF